MHPFGTRPFVRYDTNRLNPRGGLQPLIPVWTFMQGLGAAARAELEARAFSVIDFSRPHLLTEMKRAFRIPPSLRPRLTPRGVSDGCAGSSG